VVFSIERVDKKNVVTLTHEECLAAFGSQIIEEMLCVAGNYNEGTCRVCF
jgi:hypothetical protein